MANEIVLTDEQIAEIEGGPVFGKERYIAFEADGEPMTGYGARYVQRPNAIVKATIFGFGLWDMREKEIIAQPNPEERLRHWKSMAGTAEEQLEIARAKVASIEAKMEVAQ